MSFVERPLRADAERNRQRILHAAREVFADRGLTVTLDDIAHHAGVGVGTIYRRFPDKEALIDALFEDRMEELVALAEEALAGDDAWDAMAAFLERGLALQAADRGLHEVVLGSAHGLDRLARARDRLKPPVDELFARAQASGQLRPDAEATDQALVHLMLSAVVDYTRDVDTDVWRRCLTIVLDGLRTRRDGPTALPAPALEQTQVDQAMRAWRLAPR
jgi:AcrR family transcriptional regulator